MQSLRIKPSPSSSSAPQGGQGSGGSPDQVGSPLANWWIFSSFVTYQPITPISGNLWIERGFGVQKPDDFVSFKNEFARLPITLRAGGVKVAAREGSDECLALVEAFNRLDNDAGNRTLILNVFTKGARPGLLDPLLVLVKFGLIDIRRAIRVPLPEGVRRCGGFRGNHASLVHLMAIGDVKNPDTQPDDKLAERLQRMGEVGININLRDSLGRTPMHYAILRNRLPAVRGLARGGAKLNARSKDGDTPLLLAIRRDAHNCLDYLLRKGADSTARGPGYEKEESLRTIATDYPAYVSQEAVKRNRQEEEWAPIHLAAHTLGEGATRSLEILLKAPLPRDARVDPDLRSYDGDTPLHLAVRIRSAVKTAMLINAGAKVDLPGRDACRPMHLAAAWGHVDIIGRLADAGAEIESRLPWGCALGKVGACAVDLAIEYLGVDAAKCLFDRGANASPERVGRAIELGLLDLLDWLVRERGFDPNCTTAFGENLMHFAARSIFHGAAAVLSTEYGLDVNQQSTEGRYPIEETRCHESREAMLNLGSIDLPGNYIVILSSGGGDYGGGG